MQYWTLSPIYFDPTGTQSARVHRFSSPFRPLKKVRMLVAVDKTVLKVNSQICYPWAAINVNTNEILAVYASRGRGIPYANEFLWKVLDSCEGKPVIVIDRGPRYKWVSACDVVHRCNCSYKLF
jgi:transposase-like protein